MKKAQVRRFNKVKDDVIEKAVFRRRLVVSIFGMFILCLILFANLYYLQIVKFDSYTTRSNDNSIKVVPIAPPRGIIYDRNHIVLAENRPLFSLEIIPENSKNLRADILGLNSMLNLNLEEDDIDNIIERAKYRRGFVPALIAENLNEKQVAKFAVNEYLYPGAHIEATLKRFYPLGDTLTHAIGYVARINTRELEQLTQNGKINNYAATNDIGKQGIEKYYEDLLHGTSGYKEVEVDSRGRVLRTLNRFSPIPGRDISLTIDIRLQLKAQELLKDKRGAIVMLNPQNGEILAFVSSPSYDPNPFVRGIKKKEYSALLTNPDKPLINRVTQGGYAPASTVKPLLVVMGLNEDLITPSTRFFGGPFYQIPGSTHKFRDWRRWGHGWMDMLRAIEISADTYFYDLAYRAGIDRINSYMTRLGMGQKSGIDIYEESLGNMPSRAWKKRRYKHEWFPGDTISIGIGQGYWTTTLIQLARAHAILTQNGRNIVPHLLKSAHDPTGKTDDISVATDQNLALEVKNPTYWEYAKEGMCRVINGKEGTGRNAFIDTKYTACGKSGTAQVISIKQDARYNAASLKEEHRDNALFVAFAPKENPTALVAIIAENIGGGSKQAAPMARALLDDYFYYQELNTPPTQEQIAEISKGISVTSNDEADNEL